MIKIILMMMLVLPVNGWSEVLGRLFMTVQQRQQLVHSAVASSAVTQQASVLYLNGFIRDRRGRKTIWINQHDLQSAPISSAVTVEPYVTHRYQVPVDAKGQRFLLKPGQRLTLETLQMADVFQPLQQHSDDKLKAVTVSPAVADKAATGDEDVDMKALVSKYAPVLNSVQK